MIISHKHKFIFIKTAKTASTSIEVFLASRCGPDDIVTPIVPPVEGHTPRNDHGFYNHIPATLIRERVSPEVWNSYFKFCVERNPWDKVLSHYHMQVARGTGPLSLDQYLANGKFPINFPRYTDAAGEKIIVDRVLSYEHLNVDLADVFGGLKLDFDGTLGVRAKSDYRTDRTPYQSVFNEAQRKIVEQAFAREIELHGYKFESKP
jgi:Sulfotransferase family